MEGDTPTTKRLKQDGKWLLGVDYEFWECKCGNLEEFSVFVDIEWEVCKLCKRRGCWDKEANDE